MKTRKMVIAVVTAALVAILIMGCNLPNGELPPPVVKEKTAPEGKALVSLSFGDSDARTVVPNTGSNTNANQFTYFKLEIHDDTDDVDVTLAAGDDFYSASGFLSYADITATGKTIALTAGNDYIFTVSACNDTTTTPVVYLARGAATKTITTTTTIAIVLKEITSGGNGTFVWPTFGTNATSTLTPLGGGTAITKSTASQSVPAGIYRMSVQLGDGVNTQTVYVREIVYIYSGFTSTYSGTAPTLRSLKHMVTFNAGDGTFGTIPDMSSGQILNHADVILDEITTVPKHTTPASNVFDAWYYSYSAGTYADKVGTTDKIVKPITLYAKWKAPNYYNFTFSVSWSGLSTAPTITGVSAVYDPSTYSVTFTAMSSVSGDWYSDTGDKLYTGISLNENVDLSTHPSLVMPGNTITFYLETSDGQVTVEFTLAP